MYFFWLTEMKPWLGSLDVYLEDAILLELDGVLSVEFDGFGMLHEPIITCLEDHICLLGFLLLYCLLMILY